MLPTQGSLMIDEIVVTQRSDTTASGLVELLPVAASVVRSALTQTAVVVVVAQRSVEVAVVVTASASSWV